MKNRAVVILKIPKRKLSVDLDIPLDISVIELITALNKTYNLDIDAADISNCCIKSEAPIALLRGNKLLSEFGVRNGTTIVISE